MQRDLVLQLGFYKSHRLRSAINNVMLDPFGPAIHLSGCYIDFAGRTARFFEQELAVRDCCYDIVVSVHVPARLGPWGEIEPCYRYAFVIY